MSEQQVLAAAIEPGNHPEWNVLGLTLNIDTIIATLIASAIVLGLGFFVRAKATSGVPNGVQLFFETVTKFLRDQVESAVGVRTAPFLVPLSIGLFVFILAANWLVVLPLHHIPGLDWGITPPTADVNLTYALVAIVFVGWHAAGIRHRRSVGKHFLHITKGHWAPFAPLWLIEQFFVYPASLALRLFGNLIAGSIMLSLFTLLPATISWAPNAAWKLFDMFIGAIQALIFALMTIIYFSETLGDEEAH